MLHQVPNDAPPAAEGTKIEIEIGIVGETMKRRMRTAGTFRIRNTARTIAVIVATGTGTGTEEVHLTGGIEIGIKSRRREIGQILIPTEMTGDPAHPSKTMTRTPMSI